MREITVDHVRHACQRFDDFGAVHEKFTDESVGALCESLGTNRDVLDEAARWIGGDPQSQADMNIGLLIGLIACRLAEEDR
jgi:hypothetical protein